MRPLAILMLLPLSACWTGDAFYGAGDLRQPIAAGLYEISSADHPSPETVRAEILADGMTQVDATDGSRPSRLGIVPLDLDGRRFILWDDERITAGRRVDYMYGLLEQEPDGDFLIGFPQCDPAAGRSAGATVETFRIGYSVCGFHDRAHLEAALRRLRLDEPDPHLGAIRLRRIDHGAR
jgi:hypothetical protein